MFYEAVARSVLVVVLAIGSSAIAEQDPRPLKSLVDEAHQRVYLLVRDGVDIRELANGHNLAHVELPGWVWVGEKYSCPPDMAFTPERDVLVTSNIIPSVWRIDRQTFAATEHDLALDRDQGRDIGFTHLRWSRDLRAFVGTTDLGERWDIDPSLSKARKVLSPPIERAVRPCR